MGWVGALRELTRDWRLIIFATVLGLELALLFIAAATPIDAAAQGELLDRANGTLALGRSSDPANILLSIFANNARVAAAEMVPGLGGIIFVISIFTTGQVIQVIALSHGIPGTLAGVVLLLFPYTIVELSAYAVAVSSGVMLVVALVRKRLRLEARVFAFEAIVVAVALLIASVMETVLLTSPVLGFLLWGPTALGVVGLILLWGRIAR